MSRHILVVTEAIGAVLALVLAGWCWDRARITSEFGPVVAGAPSYQGTQYSGTWIVGATALVIVAGLFVIDAVRRAGARA